MRIRWREPRRTALAASAGGHRAELDRALAGITFTNAFRVTYPHGHGRDEDLPVHHLVHPRRSVLRTLANAWQAFRLVRRERPRLVVSTGADVTVAFLWWAKLSGARIVFVETGGSLAPSLSGRLVYPIADLFVVQWPQQLARYPLAVLARTPLL